ncbi:GTPase [Serinibacter salmoneus]|nr:GTPase [Serinibacter salmoneus]
MASKDVPEDFLLQWRQAKADGSGRLALSGPKSSHGGRTAGAAGDGFSTDGEERYFADGWESLDEEIPRFNLAVLGDTGSGKSSLVNAIFGEIRAESGIGAPVTQSVNAHDNKAGTLRVYDFPGFELGFTGRDPMKVIKSDLGKIQKGPEEGRIHLAWFCWDQSARRVQEPHVQAINELRKRGITVIGVVTKVRDDEQREIREFGHYIREEVKGLWSNSDGKPTVCFTRALEPTAGLKKLLDETRLAGGATFRDAIDAAQVLDWDAKKRAARTVVVAAAATAASAAAVPVPVATAAFLAPVQLAMMGKIARLMGLSLVGAVGGSGALAQLALQLTGRAAAQSLVKLVPGVGSVVNATVAAAWTYAAGEAWIYLCVGVATKRIDPSQVESVYRFLSPIISFIFESVLKDWGSRDR